MVANPTGVTLRYSSASTDTSVVISFTKPANMASVNAKWRVAAGGSAIQAAAWSATVNKGNVASWTDTTTIPANGTNKTYQWTVQAVGTDGSTSAWIDTQFLSTKPAAPTNNGTTQSVIGTIVHNFKAAAGCTESMQPVMRVVGASNWTLAPVIGGTAATSYSWTGLSSADKYEFAVYARARGSSNLPDTEVRTTLSTVATPVYTKTFITSASAVRCKTNGIPDNDGSRLACKMNWDVTSAGGVTSTTITIKYGASVVETFTAPIKDTVWVNTVNLDADKEYTVEFSVGNTVSNTVLTKVTIPVVQRLIHFWPEKMRMGVGHLGAKDNTMQVGLATEFEDVVTGGRAVYITSPVDLNTIDIPGQYMVASTTYISKANNWPSATEIGVLTVYRIVDAGSLYTFQTYTGHLGGYWQRYRGSGGAWSAWRGSGRTAWENIIAWGTSWSAMSGYPDVPRCRLNNGFLEFSGLASTSAARSAGTNYSFCTLPSGIQAALANYWGVGAAAQYAQGYAGQSGTWGAQAMLMFGGTLPSATVTMYPNHAASMQAGTYLSLHATLLRVEHYY